MTSKLSQRLQRLESEQLVPAHVAAQICEDAERVDSSLKALACRMTDQTNATAEQMQHWSPAQRTAWGMRYLGETIAQALSAIGFDFAAKYARARDDHKSRVG